MTSLLKKAGLLACLTAGMMTSAFAIDPAFQEKLNSPDRPADEKARDEARRPFDVLTLLGLQAGMTVVDVAAGGGWYTEVLSAAVGPNGKVISQIGPRALEQNNGAPADAARARAQRLGNVEPAFVNMEDLQHGIADAAVTALNLHDQANNSEEAGVAFLRNIYNVLKPGAQAVVIDHAGSPGANNRDLHRLDPAVARDLIEKAGLEVVTQSDILQNPADDRTRRAHDPDLERNSDRFLFIVRKPS